MGKYTASVEDHLILPVRVRLPRMQERAMASRGESVPDPVSIRLLIDTGSKRTTLIPGIISHLRPAVNSEVRVVTPLGTARTDLVWVCLEFPEAGLVSLSEVLVARLGMPRGLSQFHGLFGRDLLSRLHSFEYRGRRGQYVLRDVPGWLGRWL
jgi:hypothetical protein